MGLNASVFVVFVMLVQVNSQDCQPWYSNNTGVCRCGSDLRGQLICHDWNQTVDISAGFCITYDAKRKFTHVNTSGLVAGDCAYGYIMLNRKFSKVRMHKVSSCNQGSPSFSPRTEAVAMSGGGSRQWFPQVRRSVVLQVLGSVVSGKLRRNTYFNLNFVL